MSVLQITRRHDAVRGAALSHAIGDIVSGLKRWELWLTLGWHEIRQRYRRSVVGPFWLTISMGMMIGGIAYLSAGLFGDSIEHFLPYIAIGIIVFNLITSVATDGSYVFISSARTILQTKAPLSIYVYQMLWRNVLIFAHNFCIYLILLPFFKIDIGLVTLLALPGFFLIILIGFWTGIILGGLSTRFRDVPPIVASVMQVAFFLSPVFWSPSSLKGRDVFVNFNPFYYLLEVVRMPLLGQAPPLSMWLCVLAMNGAMGVVALLFLARYRARIAYWL
jgi:ABC-2 type transport system permease protein